MCSNRRFTRILLFVAFGILSTIPSISADCSDETALVLYQRSLNDFSTRLMARIYADSADNFVASALSAWALLSAISIGASGITEYELKRVLNIDYETCIRRKFYDITHHITSREYNAIVESNAMIFADSKLNVLDRFLYRLEATKAAEFKTIPHIEDTERTAAVINDHVRKATHNRIKEILKKSDLSYNVKMIAVDTMYFKGKWKFTFPEKDTRLSDFYDGYGRKTGIVNLMSIENRFEYVDLKNHQAQVVRLPFGCDGRFSMVLVVPYENTNIQTVLVNLKVLNVPPIKSFSSETVIVEMPRFKISTDLSNLEDILQDMGLKSMFKPSADFSALSKEKLYVSKFIQKAEIEVTESGVEAVAASVAHLGLGSSGFSVKHVRADRPFVFMIEDVATGVPIFIGAYNKPTLY